MCYLQRAGAAASVHAVCKTLTELTNTLEPESAAKREDDVFPYPEKSVDRTP